MLTDLKHIKSEKCRDLYSVEIRELCEFIIKKHRSLGGEYFIEEFNSNSKNHAYTVLLEQMKSEILQVLYGQHEGEKFSFGINKTIVPSEILQSIIPSKRTLSRWFHQIFHKKNDNSGKPWKFRIREIDACYLFAHGMTREQFNSIREEIEPCSLRKSESLYSNDPEFCEEKLQSDPKDLKELLGSSLDPQYLHFISLFHGKELVCHSNLLMHKDVQKWLISQPREEKLSGFVRLCRELVRWTGSIDDAFGSLKVANWKVGQILFDLEQGGLFYDVVSSEVTIIGISLNQKKLWLGVKEMTKLGEKLEDYYGIGKGLLLEDNIFTVIPKDSVSNSPSKNSRDNFRT